MLINELAQRTGLSKHAIRFYEKKGLLAKRYVRRGENDYRHFSEEAESRIGTVKTLRSAGFTLFEIADLLSKWDAGKLGYREGSALLQRKVEEIDAKIEELRETKSNLLKTLGAHAEGGPARGRRPT